MTRWLRAFAGFWYDFIVGDDWTVAAGVTTAVVISAGFVRMHITAWPVLPLVVLFMLTATIWRGRTMRPRR